MHRSITLSVCLHCTLYNPGPTAHMLCWAAAQIPALHFPVLIFKLILGYLVSFLSCSNFYLEGKEIPLHLCLFLVQTRMRDFCSHNVFGYWCLQDKGRTCCCGIKMPWSSFQCGEMFVKATVTLELSSLACTSDIFFQHYSKAIHFPQNDRWNVITIILSLISAPH